MADSSSASSKVYLAITAVLGWFALAAQLYLTIQKGAFPLQEIIIRFFSYFTILTNILVAVACTSLIINSGTFLCKFLSRARTLTAITVYIVIVGMIYNLILRNLWQPTGLQRVVDELLHLVIPVLFLFFWIIYVPKYRLRYSDITPWLIYPLLYIFYTLIRGSFSNFYPYPFVDVNQLGFNTVLINSAWVASAFILVAFLFVAIGRYAARSRRR
jgi:hypothetical protein